MFKLHVQGNGVRVLAALALLATVLTSPVRPSKMLGALAGKDSVHRSFAFGKLSAPTSVKQVPSRLVQVKAIASESDEEKLAEAGHLAGFSVDPASAPFTKFGRNLISLGLAATVHPLRC